MIGSDANVEMFKHYQTYALLQAFLAGVADIDFDNFAITYGTTTDTIVLKKSTTIVGTFLVTYSTTKRDIVSTAAYTAA